MENKFPKYEKHTDFVKNNLNYFDFDICKYQSWNFADRELSVAMLVDLKHVDGCDRSVGRTTSSFYKFNCY